jgi:hypothetical protein
MSWGIDALLLSIIGYNIGLEHRADGLVAVATDQGFLFYRYGGPIWSALRRHKISNRLGNTGNIVHYYATL